jgi:hypothetical protein
VTQLGCLLWLCLLGIPSCAGIAIGSRHEAGRLFGLGTGIVAWLAAVAGYARALTIIDVVRARRRTWLGQLPQVDVPHGVVPSIWAMFALSATVAARMLWRILDGVR